MTFDLLVQYLVITVLIIIASTILILVKSTVDQVTFRRNVTFNAILTRKMLADEFGDEFGISDLDKHIASTIGMIDDTND